MKRINIVLLVITAITVSAMAIVLPSNYFRDKTSCNSTNAIFEYYPLDNPKYTKEVHRTLESSNPKDYRYYFKTFTGKDQEYLVVNLRNETACFDVKMLVSNWDKLGGMRKTNGQSYPEELYELQWELVELDEYVEVAFVDMHYIID